MTTLAQGEVFITPISEIPAGATPVLPAGEHFILGHSETGHHHVVAAGSVDVLEPPASERIPEGIRQLYMIVREPTEFTHLRGHDTHAPHILQPGKYRVRNARERTPQGFRRVTD